MAKKDGRGNHVVEQPHWYRWPGLLIRKGSEVVEAPPQDCSVARGYPRWTEKGPLCEGRRLTIMTMKTKYMVNEEIRVIHVAEATRREQCVYVVGPKAVYGEYIDHQLVTEPMPESEDPFMPPLYDGATLAAPAIDFNYVITSYRFIEPAKHKIYWQLGRIRSNIIKVEIVGGR